MDVPKAVDQWPGLYTHHQEENRKKKKSRAPDVANECQKSGEHGTTSCIPPSPPPQDHLHAKFENRQTHTQTHIALFVLGLMKIQLLAFAGF